MWSGSRGRRAGGRAGGRAGRCCWAACLALALLRVPSGAFRCAAHPSARDRGASLTLQGLGKTLQTISLLGYLREFRGITGGCLCPETIVEKTTFNLTLIKFVLVLLAWTACLPALGKATIVVRRCRCRCGCYCWAACARSAALPASARVQLGVCLLGLVAAAAAPLPAAGRPARVPGHHRHAFLCCAPLPPPLLLRNSVDCAARLRHPTMACLPPPRGSPVQAPTW